MTVVVRRAAAVGSQLDVAAGSRFEVVTNFLFVAPELPPPSRGSSLPLVRAGILLWFLEPSA